LRTTPTHIAFPFGLVWFGLVCTSSRCAGCAVSVDKFNKLIESTLEEFADGRPVSYADFNRLLMENVFTDGDMVHWGVRQFGWVFAG